MKTTDVFEEWDSYAKRRELSSRDIDFDSIINESKVKIVAVTGIRRSGKSSVLMLLAQMLERKGEKVCYINLEDSRLKGSATMLDDAIKWFGDTGFMLLDEVTSADDWEGWLARTHELLKGRLRLIVSSSRRNLVVPAKPLRGRILPRELYPLSFVEFLRFKGINVEKTTSGRGKMERAFSEYLKYGGFPEIALTEERVDKVRILDSYFKDIVGLDVAEISGEDIGVVETFGRYVIQSPYFSASKCLNFFKTLGYRVGKEKLLSLERLSQEGYLFFFIPVFSYSMKARAQYPRKAFCGDTGFPYGIAGKLDMGRLYENAAFLELRRRIQGRKEICYWRNKEGLETDFVIKQGNDVSEVIQVVYDLGDEKTRKREVNSIVECVKELKADDAIILTKEVSEAKTVDGVKIRFVPLVDWLLA